jgi:RecB family endonuclease NucS
MSVLTYVKPSIEETALHLKKALANHRTIVIIGDCRVKYEGRAASTLENGGRLVIIKVDGSVLVHRPTGYEPVNWMPGRINSARALQKQVGCIFQVKKHEKELEIRVARLQPQEILNVYFTKILHLTVSNLIDVGEFSLYVTEADMKQAILAEPNLIEKAFRPLTAEKEVGESGFIDVFGEDATGAFLIVEIKRVPAGKDAVLQLDRYVTALREKVNRPVRGVIAAPALRKEVQTLLAHRNLEFKCLPLKKCYEVLKWRKTKRLSEFLGEGV